MSGKLWCLCVINKIKQKTSQKSKSTGQSLPSASRPRSTSLNWDVSYHRLKFLSDSGEILEQIWGTNGMVAGRVSAPRGCTGQTASVCMTRLHHKRCTSDDSHCQRGDKEFELGVDVECVWVKGEKEKNKKKTNNSELERTENMLLRRNTGIRLEIWLEMKRQAMRV